MEIAQLRKQKRRERLCLNVFQHRKSADALRSIACRHSRFLSAKRIGIYLSAFGEIETDALIRYCFRLGKRVYLPEVCSSSQTLRWSELYPQRYFKRQFVQHRLKMLEAKGQRSYATSALEIVFMPLVACDKTGMRIGMGGGFYDRTLARYPYQPYRIGLAHAFQYVETVFEAQPWDQPLHELWIPQRVIRF